MKRILLNASILFTALTLSSVASAEPPPKCDSNGKQANINGKLHTCGRCSTGGNTTGTGYWLVGDLTEEKAEAACEKLAVKKSRAKATQTDATRATEATSSKSSVAK